MLYGGKSILSLQTITKKSDLVMNRESRAGQVLIACERSQRVAKAFREIGVVAYSCDIQECTGGKEEWHIRGDVREVIGEGWDMIIAFPPCTDLTSSGARYWKEKEESGRQQEAIDFFMMFVNADCERVAIENPVGKMNTLYRPPDQIIQPYMFGHLEQKTTCLWLKGLPPLMATSNGKWAVKSMKPKDRNPLYMLGPSPTRSDERSLTYEGVARAMAQQWANYK